MNLDPSRYFYNPNIRPQHPDPVTASKMEATMAAHQIRLAQMRAAWAAYWGIYTRPLLVVDGEQDPNITVNFARIIVDKSVGALFGKNVNFDIAGNRDPQGRRTVMERDPREAWLDACWAANRKMSLLQKLALNGSVSGHGFLKLLAPSPEHGHAFPRVINLNPMQTRVLFRADDLDVVEQYIIEWDFIGPDNRSVYYRQFIKRESNGGVPEWWIGEARASSVDAGYLPVGPAVRWPYSWAPIVDCQNLPQPNNYYGLPDLSEDVLHIVDRLNFVFSNWNKTLRMHAHPQGWATGVRASQIEMSPDKTLVLPDKEAKIGLLEMMSEMNSTNMLADKLLQLLHELSRIPEVSSGKLENIGNLSGIALQILYEPLSELAEMKRENYGPLLSQVNSHLLELGNQGADLQVATQWPELLPGDPETQRKVVAMDMAMGITSKETAAGTFNHDWELERARIEQEAVADAELAAKVAAVQVR